MATSADNEYEVAKPQQQRAIETTNRILEAAYDIVAFDGYQALTTNSVAERDLSSSARLKPPIESLKRPMTLLLSTATKRLRLIQLQNVQT